MSVFRGSREREGQIAAAVRLSFLRNRLQMESDNCASVRCQQTGRFSNVSPVVAVDLEQMIDGMNNAAPPTSHSGSDGFPYRRGKTPKER